MKKLIVIILIIVIVFAGVTGYLNRSAISGGIQTESASEPETAGADAETEPVSDAEEVTVQTLDMNALYALHGEDDTVMTVDGEDISWGEYCYWLNFYASQVQNYITNMSYYGVPVGWGDSMSEDPEETYAKYVTDAADGMMLQLMAAPGLAKKDGLTIDKAAIAAKEAELKVSVVGEEGTDEEYQAALTEMKLTPAAVEHMATMNWAFNADYENKYGADGEKVSDEDALKYLEDNGYVCVTHILLTTVDSSTNEALEPSVVAEKKALAEKLYAELSAIKDEAALVARFNELKAEYCEDPGKESYPDGYVFTSGTMTESFEKASFALEEYGLSEIVESEYGYHIILRLPQDADRTVMYSDAGLARSARALAADAAYNEAVTAYIAGISPVYAEGYETPDLMDYVAG